MTDLNALEALCERATCANCRFVRPTQTAWQWMKCKPATQSVCERNRWITRLTAWCGEHEPALSPRETT